MQNQRKNQNDASIKIQKIIFNIDQFNREEYRNHDKFQLFVAV